MDRRWYFDMRDGDSIAAGDLLLGVRSCQLVLDARPTETALDVNRWTLTVRPLGPRPQSPAEWAAFRQHGRDGAREVEWVPRR